MQTTRSLAPVAALALALGVGACGSGGSGSTSGSQSTGGTTTAPAAARIDPANFARTVDNPWFPLEPGTTLRYRGVKDGKATVDVFAVTNETRKILGVPATVVHDRLYDSTGNLVEDTIDWYAQDRQGNVWYLGEATKELDAQGHVTSRSGSWQAGVHGAQAGIFMPADPKVGRSFRQEYSRGQAEDHFKILSLSTPVEVPAVSSQDAMRTEEWTPLEPGVIDHKYYVRGIGTVREAAVKGPREYNTLVSVKRG